MTTPLSSLSVVIVVRDTCPPRHLFDRLAGALERLFHDFEFVIVANDVEAGVALELKQLAQTLPDSLVVFLGEQVHSDLARLIGIDHAVSDYILFTAPTDIEIESLPLLEEPLRNGCDLVAGQFPRAIDREPADRLLFSLFRRLYRWTTGKTFEGHPTAFRILSRAAALYISTRNDGEVLVRARGLGSGFPTAEIPLSADPERKRKRPALLSDLLRGIRLITTGNTKLLRASSYLALFGGIVSAIYAVYVVVVYLLLPDVEEGWTTLSLQLSGMMFLFSVQFLLLAEHVLQIVSNSGARSRHHYIIRELRSPLSRRSAGLNVMDQEGQFQLGAPADLDAIRVRAAR